MNLAGTTPISSFELTPSNAGSLKKFPFFGTICFFMGFERTPDGGNLVRSPDEVLGDHKT
jgi:hypothetical protein